jgi:MOSC domain-containing protein YiiM
MFPPVFSKRGRWPRNIGRLNLDSDKQADLSVHGGPEKAVYAYPAEHYDYWRRELPNQTFSWGQFGENLTTEGLVEDALYVGDHLRAGFRNSDGHPASDALLQIGTQIRTR